MAGLPHLWDAYASCQAKLSKRNSVDDFSWGLEEGLNQLLEAEGRANALRGEAVDRTVASAARRARYARSLIVKYLMPASAYAEDAVARVEARSELEFLQNRMREPDLRLLIAVASGEERAKLAEIQGVSDVALRARIVRARAAAGHLLAA
jgi:hypothetical protein